MNQLREAFLVALAYEGINKQQFALSRGIHPVKVSLFLRKLKSLSPEMKSVMFTGWKNESIGIALFRAHVADEMRIAGLDPAEKLHL